MHALIFVAQRASVPCGEPYSVPRQLNGSDLLPDFTTRYCIATNSCPSSKVTGSRASAARARWLSLLGSELLLPSEGPLCLPAPTYASYASQTGFRLTGYWAWVARYRCRAACKATERDSADNAVDKKRWQ